MFPTSTAFLGSIREQRRDATEASTTSKKKPIKAAKSRTNEQLQLRQAYEPETF
jgi:hypothetical protein